MGRDARLNGRFGLIRPDGAPARRNPKVAVGFPAGGSVTYAFSASLQNLQDYERSKQFDWLRGELLESARAGHSVTPADVGRLLETAPRKALLSKVFSCQGLYVADNRMGIVEQFLRSDSDWLLQIDTDIQFEKTLIENMIALAGDDKKVLAASVPLGDDSTCAYYFTGKDGDGVFSVGHAPPPQWPVECDAVATACCLVHREVFEAIAARHGRVWFHHLYVPHPGNPSDVQPRDFRFIAQGEDLAFSVRAQEVGFKVWIVHLPGLSHHKTRALTHDKRWAPAMNESGGVGEIVQEG